MGGQALISNFTWKNCLIDISEDDDLSEAINVQGYMLLGIEFPAEWTAASVTFQGTFESGGTLKDIYDEDNNEVTWTGAGASKILLAGGTAPLIGGFHTIKVRSGVTATPVAQGADRALKLLLGVPNP